MRIAEEGIEKLKEFVDTLIIVPNQNLFRIANEKTTFAKAFEMADEVLYAGVRGVTDLMVMPGLINLDFADVRTVMREMGTAMMGMGEAEGERRAIEAAEAAISNPLLDHTSMKGARGVLINITGGMDLTLYEVDEAANKIRAEVDPEANIIVGSTFDERMSGKMRVSVVATGIAVEAKSQATPVRTATANARAAEAKAEPRRTAATHTAAMAAPIAAPAHPVHTMQNEIVQAGLAIEDAHDIDQRSHAAVETHFYESAIIESVQPQRDLPTREYTRVRQPLPPLPPQFQSEPKKTGGFSMFGITIGGTAPKKPLVQRANPAAMRLSPEQAGETRPLQTRAHPGTKIRSDEHTPVDDQLDIPAFLRRQVN
jgi:cell division protein FtsZ